jgi:carbonic anhydrase
MSEPVTIASSTASPDVAPRQFESLLRRNREFAGRGFVPDLKMLPAGKTLIIGCVDPRVDPMDIFQLEPGEAAVIRNIGGRVNPALLETLGLLRAVSKGAGGIAGTDSNLIVLHHTDCGIRHCYHHARGLLSRHLGVEMDSALDDTRAVNDPYAAVANDVATLKADPQLPPGYIVSGLVYDVATGLVETVVPPSRLRPEEACPPRLEPAVASHRS